MNFDNYIINFSPIVQIKLKALKKIIKKNAPTAEETIKYSMPTFILHGNLVHFAAFKNHIGFYPTPSAIEAFKKELSIYKTSKGAIQFPIDKPLPLGLIARIVKFRVKENLSRIKKK